MRVLAKCGIDPASSWFHWWRRMPRTDLPFCECRWLERAAHDPHCAIEFDPEVNEFHLQTTGGGFMRIFHCPFCAGRTPESLRAQMFATVSTEETTRLHLLTKDLKTEEEVRACLGEPTCVLEPGETVERGESEDRQGEIRACKTLRYNALSDTATINVNVGRYGKVGIWFSGKYVGNRPRTEGARRAL